MGLVAFEAIMVVPPAFHMRIDSRNGSDRTVTKIHGGEVTN